MEIYCSNNKVIFFLLEDRSAFIQILPDPYQRMTEKTRQLIQILFFYVHIDNKKHHKI
jgi:hypothetical protein